MLSLQVLIHLINKFFQATAQTSLYSSMDSVALAKAFQISASCLDALNEIVFCDESLWQMAGSVDDYLWDIDNVTALCTSDCLSSVSKWFTDVSGQCSNDVINVNGRLVPPLTISERVVDGMNIACLAPNTNVLMDFGVNGSVFTSTLLFESNSIVTMESVAAISSFAINSGSSSNRKRQTSGGDSSGSFDSSFCLIESYS